MLVELSKSERGARMLEKLRNSDKVVGTRRLLRAVLAGEISEVYLASDADLFIVRQAVSYTHLGSIGFPSAICWHTRASLPIC